MTALAARIQLKMQRFGAAGALLGALPETDRRRVVSRTTLEHPDIRALIAADQTAAVSVGAFI